MAVYEVSSCVTSVLLGVGVARYCQVEAQVPHVVSCRPEVPTFCSVGLV